MQHNQSSVVKRWEGRIKSDTYRGMVFIWPDIEKWIDSFAELNDITTETLHESVFQSLLRADGWHRLHPFGSIDNRSTRTMIVFIQALDENLRKIGCAGCIETLPDGIASVIAHIGEVGRG